MWEYIEGTLAELMPSHAVVAVGGVGYYISISLHTYERLEGAEAVRLWVEHRIRDEQVRLFGFADKDEREYFRRLIRISGVGTAMALSVLSTYSVDELDRIIRNGDLDALVRVKRVGRKTAGRILVDFQELPVRTPSDAPAAELRTDAVRALEMLGFARKEAQRLVDKTLRSNPALAAPEEVVAHILRNL